MVCGTGLCGAAPVYPGARPLIEGAMPGCAAWNIGCEAGAAGAPGPKAGLAMDCDAGPTWLIRTGDE